MFLAEKAVKNYVSALFAKLGMERRTQAAAYAARILRRSRPGETGASRGLRPASGSGPGAGPWTPSGLR
jgi:hypothetical protein